MSIDDDLTQLEEELQQLNIVIPQSAEMNTTGFLSYIKQLKALDEQLRGLGKDQIDAAREILEQEKKIHSKMHAVADGISIFDKLNQRPLVQRIKTRPEFNSELPGGLDMEITPASAGAVGTLVRHGYGSFYKFT